MNAGPHRDRLDGLTERFLDAVRELKADLHGDDPVAIEISEIAASACGEVGGIVAAVDIGELDPEKAVAEIRRRFDDALTAAEELLP